MCMGWKPLVMNTTMNMHICNYLCCMIKLILLAHCYASKNDYSSQNACNEWLFVLQMQLLAAVLSMARELDASYWTMWPALGLNLDFMTVVAMELVFTTAPTMKMLVPVVRFIVSDVWRTSGVKYQSGYWYYVTEVGENLGGLVLNAKFLDISFSIKSDISCLKNRPSLWNHSNPFKSYYSQSVSCSVGIMSSCSLLALGQTHVIVTMFPSYLVSQTSNYARLPYTSTQGSCQINQSKVTWQHSMWYNYCTRHKWKCTNKPTDMKNTKQTYDQLAVHKACGWLV